MAHKPWTFAEDETILETRANLTAKQIANDYLPDRSPAAILARGRYLLRRGKRKYSAQQLKLKQFNAESRARILSGTLPANKR